MFPRTFSVHWSEGPHALPDKCRTSIVMYVLSSSTGVSPQLSLTVAGLPAPCAALEKQVGLTASPV